MRHSCLFSQPLSLRSRSISGVNSVLLLFQHDVVYKPISGSSGAKPIDVRLINGPIAAITNALQIAVTFART